MSWPILETLGLAAVVLFLVYRYFVRKLEFWERRGVSGPKPLLFWGNFKDVFLGKKSFSNCLEDAYYNYRNEPMVGIYTVHTPLLVLRDPELMKDVFIKDFPKFVDRSIRPNPEAEPLSMHLFRLEGERWKPLRARLSPVFTSGKLKEMFHLLLECADLFEKYLDNLVAKGEPIECRDVSAKFTTDVIGSCAFGIEVNALTNEDCEFRKMGKKIFETGIRTRLRNRLRNFPFLYKSLGRFLVDYDLLNFFKRITGEAIDYRIKHNVRRHDFVDALVDLKQHPEKLGLEEIDDLYLTAQAFVFFAAGFETSSITIANTLYELALNQTIQDRVRAEIKEVLQKTNGEITYDCIREMKYLDACFQETLRKYPVLLWLSRRSVTDYTFSGTKVTIPKDLQVFIPVFAIQRDPEIFPNPEKYDPERFTDDNARDRHPMFYLPFGDGPRNCIGARFAKNQTKVAVIKILSKFKVEPCEQTRMTYEIDKNGLFLLQPTHGIYLKMTKL